MTADRRSARSSARSRSTARSSPRSSGRRTSERVRRSGARKATAVTTTPMTAPAAASSSRASVGGASTKRRAARHTEVFDPRPQRRMRIEQRAEVRMLGVPRPQTRLECQLEARPCPWVGCRHHLLLEVAMPLRYRPGISRAPALRLNSPSNTPGRRAGLWSSSAAVVVRAWIDAAVEQLSVMPYTCSLDVVRDYPDGLYPRALGVLLGVSRQQADDEVKHVCAREDVKRALADGCDDDE